MNAIQYPFGWQLRFGLSPAVHRSLNYIVLPGPLLLLLSLCLLISLAFCLPHLLIILSPFPLLSFLHFYLRVCVLCSFDSFLFFLLLTLAYSYSCLYVSWRGIFRT